jgi:hypothetical protein
LAEIGLAVGKRDRWNIAWSNPVKPEREV